MKKKIVYVVLLLVVLAVGGYFYIYKKHRDIATEKADYTITVVDLQKEFIQDNSSATKKYLDKTIDVKGTITNVDLSNHAVVIDQKMFAVFKDSVIDQLKIDQKVVVKGRFLGYDDLLDEFKLDQATLVE